MLVTTRRSGRSRASPRQASGRQTGLARDQPPSVSARFLRTDHLRADLGTSQSATEECPRCRSAAPTSRASCSRDWLVRHRGISIGEFVELTVTVLESYDVSPGGLTRTARQASHRKAAAARGRRPGMEEPVRGVTGRVGRPQSVSSLSRGSAPRCQSRDTGSPPGMSPLVAGRDATSRVRPSSPETVVCRKNSHPASGSKRSTLNSTPPPLRGTGITEASSVAPWPGRPSSPSPDEIRKRLERRPSASCPGGRSVLRRRWDLALADGLIGSYGDPLRSHRSIQTQPVSRAAMKPPARGLRCPRRCSVP